MANGLNQEPLDPQTILQLFYETREQFKETRELMEKRSEETDKKFQETRELMEKRSEETDKKFQETKDFFKELGQQIGGLHNKFGTFSEGLFIPALTDIAIKRFKCNKQAPRAKFFNNGDSFEIDLLCESPKAYYVFEIKSHLFIDSLKQIRKTIAKLKKFAPEYSEKPIYGIICAADYKADVMEKAIKDGLYFISASEDIVKLRNSDDFVPKAW